MQTYNKLVRDNIPAIILANGQKPTTRVLDDEELLEELSRKVEEELQEFREDRTVEELADLQEVILALADLITSRDELEATRTKKAEERGTFTQKIYLESVE